MSQGLSRLIGKSVKRLNTLRSFRRSDEQARDIEWRVLGVHHSFTDDFQYICLRLDWFRLWTVVLGVYTAFALFYAILTYRLVTSTSREHFSGELSDDLSIFEQCFWLSVGHLVSIGYGPLQPISCVANFLVTVEFFMGILLSAILLGVVVTKASLPSIKLVFSDVCILTRRNGVRHFIFRVANTRGNLLVSPDIRLCSFSHTNTEEGESIFVAQPLDVIEPPVMAPSFNVVHKIDESSPLAKFSDKELQEKDYAVSLVATDSHTYQTLYATKYYSGDVILSNVRFSDVLKRDGNIRILDFSKLNNTEMIGDKKSIS
eukprot:g4716.t1